MRKIYFVASNTAVKEKEDACMTYLQVRAEIKKLVIRKGLKNIINADLNEMHERTGADYLHMWNALNYFRYSPQTAKYRQGE